jgi:hypothetical protein
MHHQGAVLLQKRAHGGHGVPAGFWRLQPNWGGTPCEVMKAAV